jgi:hypothetical protein
MLSWNNKKRIILFLQQYQKAIKDDWEKMDADE